jgi:hypothetical protein
MVAKSLLYDGSVYRGAQYVIGGGTVRKLVRSLKTVLRRWRRKAEGRIGSPVTDVYARAVPVR